MHQQSVDYRWKRKWYIMATVAMSVLLSTIDGSIVNVALPTLVNYFHTDFATVQWVGLSYMLVITTLLLSIGRIADIIGKKPIYTAGVVVFTLGSILCGFSPTIFWLIIFRVIQAVGASMTISLGAAIITESFPPTERGKALGMIGSVVSVGVILGPALGGILIDTLSWHWIFFVNIPVGIVGAILAMIFLPSLKPAHTGQRFDYPGALTIFVSLTALLLALTIGQQAGFGDATVLILLVTWLVCFILFIIIEWRSDHPMITLSLFRNDLLSMGLLLAFMAFICVTGSTLLMPFYLENMLGYDRIHVGLLMAVVPVALGVMSPISGILSDRFGTRPISTLGLLVLIPSYFLLSTFNDHTSTGIYILYSLPIGLGMGLFQSPNNSAIMGSAPHTHLGIVSGMLSESRVLGQTLGFALVGTLWSSRVFAHVGHTLDAGATTASIPNQIAGLQETFFIISLVITIVFLMSLWGLVKQYRTHGTFTCSLTAEKPKRL